MRPADRVLSAWATAISHPGMTRGRSQLLPPPCLPTLVIPWSMRQKAWPTWASTCLTCRSNWVCRPPGSCLPKKDAGLFAPGSSWNVCCGICGPMWWWQPTPRAASRRRWMPPCHWASRGSAWSICSRLQATLFSNERNMPIASSPSVSWASPIWLPVACRPSGSVSPGIRRSTAFAIPAMRPMLRRTARHWAGAASGSSCGPDIWN